MYGLLLILATLAANAAAPTADPATVAVFTSLETRWGQAFVKRNIPFIGAIVAPEYSLAVAVPQAEISFIRHDEMDA